MKSDKYPQVMSLKSASVGSEDYKSENEKNLGPLCPAPHLYLRVVA